MKVKKLIRTGKIKTSPQIGIVDNALEITLGNKIGALRHTEAPPASATERPKRRDHLTLDPYEENVEMETEEITESGLALFPGRLYVAKPQESISVPIEDYRLAFQQSFDLLRLGLRVEGDSCLGVLGEMYLWALGEYPIRVYEDMVLGYIRVCPRD